MNIGKTIAKNIKKHREESGLTQVYVAEKIGAHIQTYSGWERKVSKPPIEWIIKIAEFYGVLVDDLVGANSWTDIENPPNDNIKKVQVYAKIGDGFVNSQASHVFGKFYIDGSDITKFVTHWRCLPGDPIK